MTGPRDKLHDDGDLDQLARDLDMDLDMDAPLGATFAAALREDKNDAGLSHDIDFNIEEDDAPRDLMTPPRFLQAKSEVAGTPGGGVFAGSFEEVYEEADSALEEDLDPDYAEPQYVSDEAEGSEFDEPDDIGQFAPLVSPRPEPMLAAPPATDRFTSDSFDSDSFGDEPPPAAPPQSDDVLGADNEASSEGSGQGADFDYAFASASPTNGDRLIPRIVIHAFCNRTPVIGLMHTIRKDRRMRNVSMEVHEGGARAAIDYYVNETTPNLLVIEAAGDPRQLLADLDSLAEYCDENIRVVVIGETNDIRLYRELMSRGVSEYLVTPVDPVQMIRSIASLFTDPDAPFMGKSLAVTGVKGGVGASSIAHNLAWAMTERVKVNSTLIDLDLNFGTTGLDFNQDTGATIADALMSPDRFDDAIMGRLVTKATDRLSLFTAPATLDRTYNLDPETYVRVLDQIRSSVPFVVLDLPHIWSEWFKSTVVSADEIVVVAAPDLASLRNGKNLIDFLKAARPNDSPPRLVLNMVGLPKRPEIPAKDFGQAIGLEPTLVLPFDAQLFGTAANNGQMIFDVAPESKIAQSIDQLASMLTGREVQAGKSSMLRKLLGR